MQRAHYIHEFLSPMFLEGKETGADGVVHDCFVVRLEVRRHIFEFLVDIGEVLGDEGGDGLVAIAHVLEEYFEVCVVSAEERFDTRFHIAIVVFLDKPLRLAVQQFVGDFEHACFDIEQGEGTAHALQEIVPLQLRRVLQNEA